MDVILQEHGATRVFPMPDGLKELSSDITREVLRKQPDDLYRFIADYTHAILVTRDKAREAAVIVHDLLFCDLTYEKMLRRRGIDMEVANRAATIIQAAYRGYQARLLFKQMKPPPQLFDMTRHLATLGIERDYADKMATRIQAYYRGYKVRRIMWEVFGFSPGDHEQDESRALLHAYLSSLGISFAMANKAAACIQKFYKEYRKKSSPAGDAADVQKKIEPSFESSEDDSSSEEEEEERRVVKVEVVQQKVVEVKKESLEMELPVVLPQDNDEVGVAEVKVEVKVEPGEGEEEVVAPKTEGHDGFSGYKTETTEGSTVTDWTEGNVSDMDMSDENEE